MQWNLQDIMWRVENEGRGKVNSEIIRVEILQSCCWICTRLCMRACLYVSVCVRVARALERKCQQHNINSDKSINSSERQ